MAVVGLTGGIGSGKSSVAALLAERGATVVDADVVAREVVEPGEPALDAITARFGADLVGPDGRLDRAALAAIVFDDPAARADLEAITHPAIGERVARRIAAASDAVAGDGPEVIVLDHPLLVETGWTSGFDAIVVVTCPVEERIRRLVARGLTAADARARIAVQASDEERTAVATHVIDNGGDRVALAAQVADLWLELTGGRG